ncbi:MAG: hypothetical protein K2Q18_19100, partial [Bdellovibrionales bacterium]|nr:hypothetical protein [Bdellovibrionales bacterium]
GTYTARILAVKAIVYADENMLSPIGYIANGKAIKVGNPRRINRDLVPLIVSGRLAFIEIKDIQYENSSEDEYKFKKGTPLEHDFDVILPKPEDNLKENNSIFLAAHAYTSGSDVKNAFINMLGKDVSNFVGLQGQFFHRVPTGNMFWGIGLDYSSISSGNSNFSYLMLGPSAGFTIIKNGLFALDVYGGLDFSVSNELKVDVENAPEMTGFIWGLQANARLYFYPSARYHVFLGGGLRQYNVEGYDDLYSNGARIDDIEKITGLSAMIGFGMDFR